jgi:hypothetical protein
MNKTVLAALNDAERQLVADTEQRALDRLDEDETLACTCASGRRGTNTSASTVGPPAPGWLSSAGEESRRRRTAGPR